MVLALIQKYCLWQHATLEIGNTKEARKFLRTPMSTQTMTNQGWGFSTDAAFRRQVYGYIEHCLPKDEEDDAGTGGSP